MTDKIVEWKLKPVLNPARREHIVKWLEKKALEGWFPEKISMGMNRFSFRKGTPSKVSYAIDYADTLTPDYHNFVQESKWDLIHKSGNAYLWRKSYDVGERKPEFFNNSDQEAPGIRTIVITLIILAYCIGTLIFNIYNSSSTTSQSLKNTILILLSIGELSIGMRIFQLLIRRKKILKGTN